MHQGTAAGQSTRPTACTLAAPPPSAALVQVRGRGGWSQGGFPSGSTLVTHLTHHGPRRPGTISRTGAPWPGLSAAPP